MSRAFAKSFYNSTAWKSTRLLAMQRENYICQRCGEPATQVHHRIWLRTDNINDPNVTLNLENLECLCDMCHAREHNLQARPYSFDDEGNLINKPVEKLKPIWRT